MEDPAELQNNAAGQRDGSKSRFLGVGCILILAAASAVAFRGVWNPLNTVEGTDAALWVPMFVQRWTQGLLVPRWFPHVLAGIAQQFYFVSHSLPLVLTIPPNRFHGFVFMLDTFLAGAFMYAFLRDRGIGHFGALIGGLSFELGNSLLTNAREGGLWRFDTACWMPLFLLFFTRILDDDPRRARNAIFAGATLGLQFLGGEVQLAYYICLLALAYFVVDSMGRVWESRGVRPLSESLRATGMRLLMATLCVIISVIFAAEVFQAYVSFAGHNENVGVQNAEDNWRFATEFSFPPRETPSLALTGSILGDDTSARLVHGQPIIHITDDYMGVVALMFAFLALLSGHRRAYFFAGAAGVTLLLSYGRFFPLPYRMIYALPAMKGLRNPHKWLFMTAICVPILAGMGAEYWRSMPRSANRKVIGMLVAFVLLICGLAFMSPIITGGTPSSLRRPLGILFLAAFACILGRLLRERQSIGSRLVLPLIVVVLLVGDLLSNASRFIRYYDYRTQYLEDDMVNWLRAQPKPFRVKLWSENPYLRKVVTEVLPYHGIDAVDAIMSRRPARYSDVFQAARDGRLSYEKLFQLFNVKYVLSATPIQNTPIPLTLAATFATNAGEGTVSQSYVYELEDFLPRVYMVKGFEVLDPREAIEGMNVPEFDFHQTVMLEKQPDINWSAGDAEPGWNVEDVSFSPQSVNIHIDVDRPSLMVFHDFLDEHWHAYVEAEEVEILRANYLMRAIPVPEGRHRVLFTYQPPLWGYTLTVFGWVTLGVSVLVCGTHALRAKYRQREALNG